MSTPQKQDGKDLGFGDAFSGQRRQRLMNPDGSFNVWRDRRRFGDFFSYAAVLQMRWPVFLLWIALGFIATNAIFGVAFLVLGPSSLALNGPDPGVGKIWRALFFSVHTFTTIGYGNVVPIGYSANALVVGESFLGFLGYSLATGLLFARFTKPTARIRFSSKTVIRPTGTPTLLIRLTNLSRSELIQVENSVVVSFFDQASSHTRCYFTLPLERSMISFMPLSWTVAHSIDESSPLAAMTEEAFRDAGGEIFVQVRAVDQVSSQAIHARASYVSDEIAWNAKFADVYLHDEQTGLLKIDLNKFDNVMRL